MNALLDATESNMLYYDVRNAINASLPFTCIKVFKAKICDLLSTSCSGNDEEGLLYVSLGAGESMCGTREGDDVAENAATSLAPAPLLIKAKSISCESKSCSQNSRG